MTSTIKLGDAATFINGYPFKPDTWTETGLPIIRIQNLNNPEAPYNHYSGPIPEKYVVRQGDILISWSASLGAYEWKGEDAYLNQHIFKVVFDKCVIDKHFLRYAVESKLAEMEKDAHGATMRHIVKKDFDNTLIPYPSIAEQEKIVAELDCLTGIIEKKKQQLEELDKLAQSIFYDMFGDPITNEKGWEVKEISYLFDVGSSKRVFEAQWRDKGVPFYRAREIVRLAKGEPIEDPIFVEESLYKEYSVKYGVPRPNDMMITGVGTLGVCYIVKADDRFYFKDGNILWFKQKGLCETRFIKEQYATDYVMNQIKGNANIVTVGTYTITNANRTKVIVPPLELQKQFVNKLEAIDRQKELVKRSIVETETLFNSRMDFWFNN